MGEQLLFDSPPALIRPGGALIYPPGGRLGSSLLRKKGARRDDTKLEKTAAIVEKWERLHLSFPLLIFDINGPARKRVGPPQDEQPLPIDPFPPPRRNPRSFSSS